MLTIPLTARHFCITIRARSPIVFNDYTGSALRGALASALRAGFCPGSAETRDNPVHQLLCPVCRLLTLENDGSIDGDIRRPYALEPDPAAPTTIAAGEQWHFNLAIYGDDPLLLQFLLVSIGGMGELGLGRKGPDGQRGRFGVEQIESVHPLTGERHTILAPGERFIRDELLVVTHEAVMAAADRLATQLAEAGNRLTVRFLTPTRVMQNQQPWRTPDFFALSKLVTQRVLDLSSQYGGGRPTLGDRPFTLKTDLYPHADQVQLLTDMTHWWDVKGFSTRVGREQVLGGLVGCATYAAADWTPLLPWLLRGASTHVGKNAVKGCGIYQLTPAAETPAVAG
jgi:hypothetical protein